MLTLVLLFSLLLSFKPLFLLLLSELLPPLLLVFLALSTLLLSLDSIFVLLPLFIELVTDSLLKSGLLAPLLLSHLKLVLSLGSNEFIFDPPFFLLMSLFLAWDNGLFMYFFCLSLVAALRVWRCRESSRLRQHVVHWRVVIVAVIAMGLMLSNWFLFPLFTAVLLVLPLSE